MKELFEHAAKLTPSRPQYVDVDVFRTLAVKVMSGRVDATIAVERLHRRSLHVSGPCPEPCYSVAGPVKHPTPKKPENATDRIGSDEIREAVGRSGYPLELRLWKRLRDEPQGDVRIHTSFNPRVVVGPDGGRREVDLEARFYVWAKDPDGVGEGIDQRVFVRVLIEAKGMPTDAAFVGFAAPSRAVAAARLDGWSRCFFGGYPSCQVFNEADASTDAVLNSAVPTALNRLSAGEDHCVQWAVARRGKNGQLVANHDDDIYDGLDTLVQAANSLERHHARAAFSRAQLAMSLSLPALVVPDGRLYVTDVETNIVRPAEWLVLTRPYDLGIHVQHRVVDVFEERALPGMIARYGQVLREMLAAIVPNTRAFERAGAEDAIARRSRGA